MKSKKGGSRIGMKVSGNPDVFAEADKKTGTLKKGGRVKRATGGKVKAAPVTKDVGFMTGGAVRPRLDRPGRKAGGRVGANTSPLSTAHKGGASNPTPSPKDTYGGNPAD